MKYLNYILYFYFSFTVVQINAQGYYTLDDFQLSGQVNSVSTMTCYGYLQGENECPASINSQLLFDRQAHLIEISSLDSQPPSKFEFKNGLLVKTFGRDHFLTYEYNNQNKIAYTYHHSLSGETSLISHCYYDQNGNLIKQEAYSEGVLILYRTFEYNTKGWLVEYNEFPIIDNGSHYKETYVYQKDGSFTKQFYSGPTMNLGSTNSYNSEGNLVQRISDDEINGELCTESYKYNQHGDITDYYRLRPNGLIDHKTEYTYNSHFNLIQKIDTYTNFYGRSGINREIYEYQYDDQGNWISKIGKVFNADMPPEITKTDRIITYFGSEVQKYTYYR